MSNQLMGSKRPLLLLRVEPIGHLLGDQGGVAASPVVDNEVYAILDNFLIET